MPLLRDSAGARLKGESIRITALPTLLFKTFCLPPSRAQLPRLAVEPTKPHTGFSG